MEGKTSFNVVVFAQGMAESLWRAKLALMWLCLLKGWLSCCGGQN